MSNQSRSVTGHKIITGETYSLESGCWKVISRWREHAPESDELEICIIDINTCHEHYRVEFGRLKISPLILPEQYEGSRLFKRT